MTEKDEEKKAGKYCSCYQYKTRFMQQKYGWDRRGRVLVEDVYVISSSFCIFLKKNFFDLMFECIWIVSFFGPR